MAGNKSCNGFRICCELQICVTSKPVKAFVFIRIVEWTLVKDVKSHIMKIFNLKGDIDLYIDGCLLPENESIKLINSNDVLVVKNCATLHEDVSVDYETFITDIKSVEHNEITTTWVDESLLETCLDELSKKRKQLIKTENKWRGGNITEKESSDVGAEVGIPVKRKRKRKHKKKNISIDNILNCNQGDTKKIFQIHREEQSQKNISPETKVFDGSKSIHKRFSDEDEAKTTEEQSEEEETEEAEGETNEKILKPESGGEDVENPELVVNSFMGESNDANDLKSKLLSLASDNRKSGKIFSRLNHFFR